MDFRIWSLPTLGILSFYIYNLYLQNLYGYFGLVPIEFGVENAVLALAWLGLAATIYPREIRYPSDLLLLFYTIISFMWGALLWPATNLLSFEQAILMLILLYIPAFAILAARRFVTPVLKDYVMTIFLFRRENLHVPLVLLLIVVGTAAYIVIGHGGFGISSVYERRLEGRELLGGRVFLGYALNMAVNGAAPLLAFVAGWRRSPLLLVTVLCFAVLLYWLLGLKSPFVNITALWAAGFVLRSPAFRRRFSFFAVVGLLAIFAFVGLQVLGDSYSVLADLGVRRVAVVQPQLQSYYLDLWFSLEPGAKLFGAPLGNYSDWTFVIGETYLHSSDANANTNAFFYSLLQSGLVGYLVAVGVVAMFSSGVDALFTRSRMPEFFGVAGLCGILISEQAYTTALLSSGIFLCLALVILFAYPSERSSPELVWKI